jgi:hypothetical protein
MPDKILLIRHAEKPVPGQVRGVAPDGREDPRELSVAGWQRAGALAALLAPARGEPPAPLARPQAIFACAPDPKSVRSLSTVRPLADRLGLAPDVRWGNDGEAGVSAAAAACPGTVLIAWKHDGLPVLGRLFSQTVPARWPEDSFDLVWLFERAGDGWRFDQICQCLLAGDPQDPIVG